MTLKSSEQDRQIRKSDKLNKRNKVDVVDVFIYSQLYLFTIKSNNFSTNGLYQLSNILNISNCNNYNYF